MVFSKDVHYSNVNKIVKTSSYYSRILLKKQKKVLKIRQGSLSLKYSRNIVLTFFLNTLIMIPKIIHQIWSGIDKPLNSVFRALGETWQEHHPEWQYEFWDDERMNSFICKYYPQYKEIYNRYPYNVQRWDTIRYLILYQMGGLYVDFDYECLENIEPLLTGKTCCFAMEPASHAELFNKAKMFNNALIASTPAHLFLKKVINSVFSEDILQYDTSNKMSCVLNTTGPLMLGNVYSDFKDQNSIYLIPAKYVSPFSKKEVETIINGANPTYLEEKLQEAYAIHYFWGGWI